jgi:hypothetical protein
MKDLAALENKTKTAKRDKGTIAAEQIVDTQKEAAKYTGVAERTIRRWKDEEGMTMTADGKYIKSILDIFRVSKGRQPSEVKNKKETASAEKESIRAEREKFEFEMLKGEWVRVQDVERGRIDRIGIVKRALLGLPRKIALQVANIKDPRKIEVLMGEEIKRLINDFSGNV